MNTLSNVQHYGVLSSPQNSRVESTIILENDKKEVSTHCAHTITYSDDISNQDKFWFAMRTTYGREKKAYDYVVSHGGTAYCPMRKKEYHDDSGKKIKEISLLPNIFFIYGTEDEVKEYAYDNVNLSYLRFYYRQKNTNGKIQREPLIVPDNQMNSFRILCDSPSETMLVPDTITKFHTGQLVKVVEGEFAGIVGRVARWHGQQRVAIIIDGLCTIATAYVPSSFLKKIDI